MIYRPLIYSLVGFLFNIPILMGQKVWKEKDGIVIIEAEDANSDDLSNGKWNYSNIVSGYTGSGYIRWDGKPLQGNENNILSYVQLEDDRVLDYAVEITKTGTYYMRVRNYHKYVDGDNDCFLSLNYGHFNKTWDSDVKVFSYENNHKNSNKINIDRKGIYRISIGGRSRGFCVDRLVLLHEDVVPENWGADPFIWMEEASWATAPASEIWIDDAAPSAPENFQLLHGAGDTLIFAWEPSHDENGISIYEIFNGEQTFSFRSDTFMMVKGLIKQEYNFSVKAIDGAGNYSDRSNVLVFSTTKVKDKLSQKTRVRIYPNPVHDFFTIDFLDDDTSLKKIDFFSVEGMILKQFQRNSDEKSITFPVSQFGKGIYFLNIWDQFQSRVYPIIIN